MPAPPALPLERPPRRVLLVRMSHLGDIVQSLPLLHGLRAAWPDARFAWALQPEFADLVAPLVDEVIPFARRGGAAAWPRIRRAMGRFAADLCVDAQGNWKSAAAAGLSGAPVRVGFPRAARQEPLAAAVFRVAAVELGSPAPRHLVDLARALAARLTDGALPPVHPGLSDPEREEGAALWRSAGGGAGAILLHPGAPGDPRSWPGERYAELGTRLLERGDRVVVVTGPAEAEVGASLRARLPGAGHLVGQRGLRSFAGMLDAAARDGALAVTGDSGPAHAAAAVGLPVALLAGPEDPERTGPWPPPGREGSPHLVLAPPTAGPWRPRPITVVSVAAALEGITRRR